MPARHSCSGWVEQRHQHTRADDATTSRGVVRPFFSECHSEAIRGKQAFRLLELDTLRFAQNGHPVPLARLFGFARQR
jgi:hypothetical protein